ncbi:COX15/CtaA family protein [Fontivita pretiosa]|uniref:COX15/CtaA family protein n=1 Tax=Fontivita pretiosa TaxID=2989684 RepID=UPI003D1839A4
MPITMTDSPYIPLLHRTAQLTVAATLLLIFMGGLVTSHGAGMSVPDWPNSYGYNMFTFPPSKWIGGIFYEHTHRLMGTVVGMLSIAMVVIAFKLEPRRWVRWLTAGVLGAVIFQGVLGGLRVVLVELDLAIVHACVAQAFLCLAALVAIVTSKWWLSAPPDPQPSPNRLIGIALACAVAIYLQLIIGAMMRHYGAGLAIPDFPLHYGRLVPPLDQQSLAIANEARIAMQLGPVTLGQVWLHLGHRIGALIVSILIITTAAAALTRHRELRLRRPALLLVALLIAQLVLGILTVLWRKPADVASLHVAVGALTLMTTFVLLIRAIRLYSPIFRRSARRRGIEVSNLKSNQASIVPA